MTARKTLRTKLRARRRALSPASRADAALAAAGALLASPLFRRCGTLAAFVAADGEADPGPVVAAARARGRAVCLPVLAAHGPPVLAFIRTAAGQPLYPNRYGIPEPAAGPRVGSRFLDLVLVPLVAFDGRGHRLGMGAGYYDRTFAFRRARRHWQAPLLIGFAYEFQRVDTLDNQPWDVPLDGVVTETGVQLFQE